MTIKEIVEKFGNLEICERRALEDNYAELVFAARDTKAWEGILTEIFGPAMKPPKDKLSKENLSFAACYGGVRKGQTFFRKDFDSVIFIAMLWPWQDGEHITLKIAFPCK